MGWVRSMLRARLGRGVLAGNPFWIAVGSVVVVRRLLRWLAPRKELVLSERLNPGEAMVIAHLTERGTDTD